KRRTQQLSLFITFLFSGGLCSEAARVENLISLASPQPDNQLAARDLMVIASAYVMPGGADSSALKSTAGRLSRCLAGRALHQPYTGACRDSAADVACAHRPSFCAL